MYFENSDENLSPILLVNIISFNVGIELGQFTALALMLLVMHQRAFGVAYAYIKTEPVLVAVHHARMELHRSQQEVKPSNADS